LAGTVFTTLEVALRNNFYIHYSNIVRFSILIIPLQTGQKKSPE